MTTEPGEGKENIARSRRAEIAIPWQQAAGGINACGPTMPCARVNFGDRSAATLVFLSLSQQGFEIMKIFGREQRTKLALELFDSLAG